MQCPICGSSGSCQMFLNREGRIRYARVRNYSHINRESHKPQFTYCRLEDLNALETLLKSLNFQFPIATAQNETVGQSGHKSTAQIHKSGQADLASVLQFKGAGSSVRIEHHPPKVGVVGSNPTPPVTDTPRTVLEIFAFVICVF